MSINRDELSIYSAYRTILLTEAKVNKDLKMKGSKKEVKDMDPEKFRQFDFKLSKARYQLFKNYPFFGLVLQSLKTVPTFDFDTMAVDANQNIYINPDFALGMTDSEVMAVLAHEVLHIMNETFFRKGTRDMEMWNWATDYIMNGILKRDGFNLPKMGLIPVRKNDKWLVVIKGIPPIDVTDARTGLFVQAEILYNELDKHRSKLQPMRDVLNKLQQMMDQHLSDQQSDQVNPCTGGMPGDIKGGGVYIKNPITNKSEGEKREKNNTLVHKALDEAKRVGQMQGDGGGIPRGFEENFYRKPAVNWKQLLKKFIVNPTKRQKTYSKINRRLSGTVKNFVMPATKTIKNDLDATIAIDTSGSIGDDVLGSFLGEIYNLANANKEQNLNLMILLFHSSVYRMIEINSKSMQSPNIVQNQLKSIKSVVEGGGTTLSCIKKYLDKVRPGKKIKGVFIVFTDGEVESNPVLPEAPKKICLLTGTDESKLKGFNEIYPINPKQY